MYIHKILTPHTPITLKYRHSLGLSAQNSPRICPPPAPKNKSRQNHKDFVYSLILSPNFFCDFFYKLQFCPLFFFCKFITYFARCKTTLRTKVKSIKRNIFFLFGINYAKDPFFRDIKRAMWLSGARWVAI